MATPPVDFEKVEATCRAFRALGPDTTIQDGARALQVAPTTLRRWLSLCGGRDGGDVIVHAPDTGEGTVNELIESRIALFERKQAYEAQRRLIPVTVNDPLPLGVLHFGDPHVDDDGTDLKQLRHHMGLTRSVAGLYGANVGDTTNNWVGRLARLYANQGTSASDAWKIAEWFINGTRWMYILGGNHDLWSGAGDPLRWITSHAGVTMQDSEIRLELRFRTGQRARINARHDFDGHSQWNPTHGVMKALQLGMRDHLAVAGHRHISGYSVLKDPDSGITMHALRVASYKIYDSFAREKGMRDQSVSPCALTTFDTGLPDAHPDFIKVFWNPDEGAEYLTWLRARRAG